MKSSSPKNQVYTSIVFTQSSGLRKGNLSDVHINPPIIPSDPLKFSVPGWPGPSGCGDRCGTPRLLQTVSIVFDTNLTQGDKVRVWGNIVRVSCETYSWRGGWRSC